MLTNIKDQKQECFIQKIQPWMNLTDRFKEIKLSPVFKQRAGELRWLACYLACVL